jgi:hypothetical protein
MGGPVFYPKYQKNNMKTNSPIPNIDTNATYRKLKQPYLINGILFDQSVKGTLKLQHTLHDEYYYSSTKYMYANDSQRMWYYNPYVVEIPIGAVYCPEQYNQMPFKTSIEKFKSTELYKSLIKLRKYEDNDIVAKYADEYHGLLYEYYYSRSELYIRRRLPCQKWITEIIIKLSLNGIVDVQSKKSVQQLTLDPLTSCIQSIRDKLLSRLLIKFGEKMGGLCDLDPIFKPWEPEYTKTALGFRSNSSIYYSENVFLCDVTDNVLTFNDPVSPRIHYAFDVVTYTNRNIFIIVNTNFSEYFISKARNRSGSIKLINNESLQSIKLSIRDKSLLEHALRRILL